MIVSVCMITYNHGNYITQAVESIISQQTNFDFELVIGEDYSTDDTRLKISELMKKYPGKIKPSFRESNIGMTRNFLKTTNECEGRYIAFCEGDDYWTDPQKLQKQVDFLEANTDCGLVFTNHYSKYEFFNNSVVKSVIKIPLLNSVDYATEILKHNFIGTQTVMARKSLLADSLQTLNLPEKNWSSCDTPLWCLMAMRSRIGFLRDYTAVYRVHDNSASSKSLIDKALEDTRKFERMIFFFLNNYEFRQTDKEKIENQISKRYLRIAFQHNKPDLAAKYINKLLTNNAHSMGFEKIKYTCLLFFAKCQLSWSAVHLMFKAKIFINIHYRNHSVAIKIMN